MTATIRQRTPGSVDDVAVSSGTPRGALGVFEVGQGEIGVVDEEPVDELEHRRPAAGWSLRGIGHLFEQTVDFRGVELDPAGLRSSWRPR
jgi:hypothetical protein